ncbi:DUF3054 domain-containing protein [Candidatus Chloroploca sp. M-50]|uniref:DUF3054 domain-containing protein n=1 Tax=Candidatus Chloroploca mongolica TaxID=2528176 RepID=A0ABS4D4P3_9CHLR|nr:DUF3054 domain-containing protein [Candidatus Chloroploca mongolica]MBP1464398.1 DUF3054 domain-containing protein [Candidatus Chloroploca mongolica]
MKIEVTEQIAPVRTAGLVTGDVVAFLVFAAIGRGSHGLANGPEALVEVTRTAAPFLAGWLVVAPLVGAYNRASTSDVGGMLRTTLLGWSGGIIIGSLVRAAMMGRFSPISFYVVTFIAALIIVGGWRTIFALIERR